MCRFIKIYDLVCPMTYDVHKNYYDVITKGKLSVELIIMKDMYFIYIKTNKK